jgi:hypothetical protein
MARSTALRRGGWGGGRPSAAGIALRVLLVIGAFKLVALAAGGAFFFVPWMLLPLVFLLVGVGLTRGWHAGHGQEYGHLPPAGDSGDAAARPMAGDEADAAREREYRLEAELATAHRQIRDLQEQLSWQGRLLKSAGATPEAPPPPVPPTPPAAPEPPASPASPASPEAPAAPRQSPAGGPEAG